MKVYGNINVTGPISAGRSGLKLPRTLAYATSAQIIPDTTLTDVNLGGELIDSLNWHSTSTNTDRITVTLSGLYYVEAGLEYVNGTVSTRRVIQFRINDTTVPATSIQNDNHTTSETWAANLSTWVELNSGDWINIRTRQNSGGDLNTVAAGTYLHVMFLGDVNA